MSLPIGLVGCGRWGRHILRDLILLGCEVHVVARSDESVRRARDGGAATIVGTVAALPQVAGYIVATTSGTHAEVIQELLATDRPIYCEKPLTLDAASARRLAALAPDRLFVMHKWRYHPGIEHLAAAARSNTYGRILGLRTHRLQHGDPHPDTDPLWTYFPHDLSIVLEILGSIPDPAAVAAEVVGGRTLGMSAILGVDPWVDIEFSIRRPERHREIRLCCEEASLVLADAYADSIAVVRLQPSGAESPIARIPISTELPLLRELRSFVDHVRGGPPPKSSATEACRAVEVLEALSTWGRDRY